ncbi:MAG: hypothetical protein HY006_04345 [Candidatus Sungbacteria bacterium]|nr:hypothetical protein [Candidatus Sungbacteria bacterium]
MPVTKEVINPEFWVNPDKAARGLLGKLIIVGKITAAVLAAQGYTREDNEKGIYEPIVDMAPGEVFCPRQRNSIYLLIATLDHGQRGGCVLIRAVEVGGVNYNGPGVVSQALGIGEPRITGHTEWKDERTLRIILPNTKLEPAAKPKRRVKLQPGNGISMAVLHPHMPEITTKYMAMGANPGIGLEEFINGFLQCKNVREFGRKLKE